MKRRWQMINRCNCCKDSEELVDCILIHYVKRRELWMFLLAIFGLVWVFPTLVRNLLLEWKVKRLDKKKRAFISKIKWFFHLIAFKVVLGFFGVGALLYFYFLSCSILWLAIPCFCRLTLSLFVAFFGLFCVYYLYM